MLFLMSILQKFAPASIVPRMTLVPVFKRDSFSTITESVKENIMKSSSRIRVVTDIDDTVKSSGGVRLLGVPLGITHI